YPIEQLAENGDFLETCYLLLYGELPTKAQKQDFDYRVNRHTMVHEQMSRFFQGFRRDAHPMSVMCGSVGAMAAFYHDSTDISDPMQRMIASMRMIAKMPTLAAMAYKYSIGQPFVYPKNDLDYATNFLRMCFAVPCEEYKPNPVLARAMDRIFILHADHEQNASTSTVRLSGSSGANPFARIALHDEYFIEKKLYPNVDYYSGITLKAMGFPTSMFTVLFAVARTVGWIAQWKEMIEDPSQKIGRPRQLYTGAIRRDYNPISRRR